MRFSFFLLDAWKSACHHTHPFKCMKYGERATIVIMSSTQNQYATDSSSIAAPTSNAATVKTAPTIMAPIQSYEMYVIRFRIHQETFAPAHSQCHITFSSRWAPSVGALDSIKRRPTHSPNSYKRRETHTILAILHICVPCSKYAKQHFVSTKRRHWNSKLGDFKTEEHKTQDPF